MAIRGKQILDDSIEEPKLSPAVRAKLNTIGSTSEFREVITVVGTVNPGNVLVALTNTPLQDSQVKLFVNGIQHASFYTVSSGVVTWDASAPYSLTSTDFIEAIYDI